MLTTVIFALTNADIGALGHPTLSYTSVVITVQGDPAGFRVLLLHASAFFWLGKLAQMIVKHVLHGKQPCHMSKIPRWIVAVIAT
jgi:hypothetical protein